MKAPADVKRRLTPDGQAFSTDRTVKNRLFFKTIIIYKEVLDDGSTKEKSIKGKKR